MISDLAWKGGTTSELRGWDHVHHQPQRGLCACACVCVKHLNRCKTSIGCLNLFYRRGTQHFTGTVSHEATSEMGYPAWPTGRTCNPLCTNFDVNLFFVNGNRLSQEPDRRSFAHAAIWFTYYLMLELLMPASNLAFIFWFWTCWCLIPTWLILPLWNHLNTFLVVINYRYLFVDITMYIAEGSLGSLLQFGCHLKGFSSQQITPMIQFFIYCVKPVLSYGYYYILFQ